MSQILPNIQQALYQLLRGQKTKRASNFRYLIYDNVVDIVRATERDPYF